MSAPSPARRSRSSAPAPARSTRTRPATASYLAAPQVQQSFAVGLAAQTIELHVDAAVPGAASATRITQSRRPRPRASPSPSRPSGERRHLHGQRLVGVARRRGHVHRSTPISRATRRHQAAAQAQQSFSVAARRAQHRSRSTSRPPRRPVRPSAERRTRHGNCELRPCGRLLGRRGERRRLHRHGRDCRRSSAQERASIDANQPGNGSYQAAPQVQQSFAVGLATQTIGFTSTPPAGAFAGRRDYTVTATASSGLAVTSALPREHGRLHDLRARRCRSSAAARARSTRIRRATAAIRRRRRRSSPSRWPHAPPRRARSRSTSPRQPAAGCDRRRRRTRVAATASSGLAVAFSAASRAARASARFPDRRSRSSATETARSTPTRPATSYHPAPQKHQSFPIAFAQQNITFTSTPPAAAVVGGAPYTVAATASSGLRSSSPPTSKHGICTVSGSTVSLVGAGAVPHQSEPGRDSQYDPAPQVQQSFTVGRGRRRSRSRRRRPGNPQARPAVHDHATATSGLAVSSAQTRELGVCSVSGVNCHLHRQGRLHRLRRPARERGTCFRAAGAADDRRARACVIPAGSSPRRGGAVLQIADLDGQCVVRCATHGTFRLPVVARYAIVSSCRDSRRSTVGPSR